MSIYLLLDPRDVSEEFEARLPALLAAVALPVAAAVVTAVADDNLDFVKEASSPSSSLDSPTAKSSSTTKSSSEPGIDLIKCFYKLKYIKFLLNTAGIQNNKLVWYSNGE